MKPQECYEHLDDTLGPERKPGVFFYGPVIFRPVIHGFVRLSVQEATHTKPAMLFPKAYEVPPTPAFDTPELKLGSHVLLRRGEEYVSLKAKRRPVVILAYEAQEDAATVIPAYSLKPDRFKTSAQQAELAKIRAFSHRTMIYLPKLDEVGMDREGYLDLTRIQQFIFNQRPGQYWHEGTRLPDGRGRLNYLKLSDAFMAVLKERARAYFGL